MINQCRTTRVTGSRTAPELPEHLCWEPVHLDQKCWSAIRGTKKPDSHVPLTRVCGRGPKSSHPSLVKSRNREENEKTPDRFRKLENRKCLYLLFPYNIGNHHPTSSTSESTMVWTRALQNPCKTQAQCSRSSHECSTVVNGTSTLGRMLSCSSTFCRVKTINRYLLGSKKAVSNSHQCQHFDPGFLSLWTKTN